MVFAVANDVVIGPGECPLWTISRRREARTTKKSGEFDETKLPRGDTSDGVICHVKNMPR